MRWFYWLFWNLSVQIHTMYIFGSQNCIRQSFIIIQIPVYIRNVTFSLQLQLDICNEYVKSENGVVPPVIVWRSIDTGIFETQLKTFITVPVCSINRYIEIVNKGLKMRFSLIWFPFGLKYSSHSVWTQHNLIMIQT